MNNNNISTDEIFASIAAGCTDYNDLFTQEEMAQIEVEVNKVDKTKKAKVSNSGNLPDLNILKGEVKALSISSFSNLVSNQF